ncbi:uncharacterized protein [Drosophila suzukii]|uniref:Uncharacterized protein n=1 Tax=Drosophila suzukii TaxID=28584 RepID=A0AB39Z3P1_DROSZ|nr:uncharacterized protein LOC108008626 [Drosophila suzukii]
MLVASQFQTLCSNLFSDSMTHVCSAKVPESLTKKYRNRLINPKDPYSIYQLDSRNTSYLLVFHFEDMPDCQTIQLTDVHNLNCQTNSGESKNLYFGYSHRMCYNYTMDLTSALKEHCGARGYEENMQSGYYYTNHDPNPDIRREVNAGALMGLPTLLICLIISILLLAFLRWKTSRL